MSTEWLAEIERLKAAFPALSVELHRREIERRMIPLEPSTPPGAASGAHEKGAPKSAREG